MLSERRVPLTHLVLGKPGTVTLVRLAEATNIPVITSGDGKGTIPDSHPLAYGSCVSSSRRETRDEPALRSDAVRRLRDRNRHTFFAEQSGVNINIDDTELTRIQYNTIPLHGDARTTLEALLPYPHRSGGGRPSVEAVTAARRLISHYDIMDKEPQYPILKTIQSGIPEDAFVVWGITQFGFYAHTHYQVNHPKTYIDSGYSFNLGYSFPTALGVKVAKPDRPVVCVVRDGGFMFNSAELSTAVKYGINVTTLIFRNDSYGNVARDLDEFFDGTYETDLHNPDFVDFAESFGAVGMRADDPMELETLIPIALERQEPVIIDVPIGHMPLPRARLIQHVSTLPWTVPQEGLIWLYASGWGERVLMRGGGGRVAGQFMPPVWRSTRSR